MRHIIFGTKARDWVWEYLYVQYISNLKVMHSQSWIIKASGLHLKLQISCRLFESLSVSYFIKSFLNKASSSFCFRQHEKGLTTQSYISFLQMAPNGNVIPSVWYVVWVNVLRLWHIKRTLSLFSPRVLSHLIDSCLCLSSSTDFSSLVILY